jgi:hypothetical protein
MPRPSNALLGLALAASTVGCGADPSTAPPAAAALSTALRPRQTPAYYVAQAELYFDTLDTRADPALVPNYSSRVARWEWPPWYLLTGYERMQMITGTRLALSFEPSTVPTRDCRAFPVQPFARCRVSFVYKRGPCPIFEEFTFNDQGEMTFIEAWSDQPGMRPTEDPNDAWAEAPTVRRLSTRVPGLGNANGLIEPGAEWMAAAAARDPELADFVRRTQSFYRSWAQAYSDAGPTAFPRGCGWSAAP